MTVRCFNHLREKKEYKVSHPCLSELTFYDCFFPDYALGEEAASEKGLALYLEGTRPLMKVFADFPRIWIRAEAPIRSLELET